jgi:hypothetical protein
MLSNPYLQALVHALFQRAPHDFFEVSEKFSQCASRALLD